MAYIKCEITRWCRRWFSRL